MNSHGVAVSALGDTMIDVVVYLGEENIDGIEYISGILRIGNKGLILGNEAAGSFTTLAWPSGKTRLRVYANATKDNATKIIFVLKPMDNTEKT
jgi:hypothetical protein